MAKEETVIQKQPNASAYDTAGDVAKAKLKYDPQIAQQAFEIATNPTYGLEPFTKAVETARQNVLPQESAVRDQLLNNILGNLLSPTGISPDQQSAITQRRGKAQTELQRAIRERSNLGGGLLGGRSQLAETEAVSDLQNAFAEEDIAREERARLNAISSAIPALQILFPGIGISAPAFQSPAPSGNAALQALTSQRGQDINQQLAQAQQQSALQSALFSELGQAVGGYTGGSAFNNLLTR